MSYATIIVGTDGSESSLTAVERAAEVASAAEALLIVVCAYSPMTAREGAILTRSLGDTRFGEVPGTEPAQEALATGAKRAQDAGATRVEGKLVEGDPGQALLSVAEERSADLIVVGNRGINTLSARLLGSVPSDVSHRARCDVLIVRTTEGGA